MNRLPSRPRATFAERHTVGGAVIPTVLKMVVTSVFALSACTNSDGGGSTLGCAVEVQWAGDVADVPGDTFVLEGCVGAGAYCQSETVSVEDECRPLDSCAQRENDAQLHVEFGMNRFIPEPVSPPFEATFTVATTTGEVLYSWQGPLPYRGQIEAGTDWCPWGLVDLNAPSDAE